VVVYGQKGIGDFEEDGVKIHLLKNQKYTFQVGICTEIYSKLFEPTSTKGSYML
jgi:hypothetical protein